MIAPEEPVIVTQVAFDCWKLTPVRRARWIARAPLDDQLITMQIAIGALIENGNLPNLGHQRSEQAQQRDFAGIRCSLTHRPHVIFFTPFEEAVKTCAMR